MPPPAGKAPVAPQDEPETIPAGEMTKAEAAHLLRGIQVLFEDVWPEVKTVLLSDQMLTDVADVAGRLPEFRQVEAWHNAAQRARASPVLRGEKPGSKGRLFGPMTLSWFLRPDNLANVINGVHDEREAPRAPEPEDAANYDPLSRLSEGKK